MYAEEELLPISALQHLAFCERQWGLIHLEGAWSENRLTAEGRRLHEKVHEAPGELRGGVRIARGLRIRSLELGLIGISDVVEFHSSPDGDAGGGAFCRVPGLGGRWRTVPVEYKRGKPKRDNCDAVQLCAQALCLEEMLGVRISEGHLFYARPRRRTSVQLTNALRSETARLALRLHALQRLGETPTPPAKKQRCRRCSLADVCLPAISRRRSVSRYMASVMGGVDES